MNAAPVVTFWLQLMGLLASEVALAVGATVLISRFTASAVWRRTIWQACILSLLALALFELTGAAREAAAWLGRKIRFGHDGAVGIAIATGQNGERASLPRLTGEFRRKVAEQFTLNHQRESAEPEKTQTSAAPAHPPHPEAGPGTAGDPKRNAIRLEAPENFSVPDSVGTLWLGLIWLTGAGLVTARSCVARVLFALFRRRCQAIRDADLQNRVEALARLLGINRRVRLVESARLRGPIVFGVLRPTIGLPAGFTKRFDSARQEAMLAHELAHLAAHDPFWYLLADWAIALLWWQPLVWWARLHLHAASEQAADEASLLVADGPNALAECLVELGARLARQSSFVRMGVEGNGFRSGLGRRVERLVNLRHCSWQPPAPLRSALAKIFGTAALVAAVILCTAWVGPQAFTKGESMKAMKQIWKRSLAAFALLASLQEESHAALAVKAEREDKPIDVARLVQDGKLLYEMGKLDEAELKFKEADAFYYLTLLEERRYAQNAKDRSKAQTAPQSAADKSTTPVPTTKPGEEEVSPSYYNRLIMERYGLIPKGAAQAAKPPTAVSPGDLMRQRYGLPAAKREKGRVESKLEEIVLDEVMFDGTPLPEVLKSLDEESRERDPEKQGLNFLINPNIAPPLAATVIDPVTGQPIPPPPPEPLEMNSVVIRFNLPLRNVRLKDVLEAVVKVADNPIEYSVEDYGVVFSQRLKPSDGSGSVGTSGPMPLQVRTFKVEADKLLPGMQRAFGIIVEKSGSGPGEEKPASPDTDLEKIRRTINEQEKRLAELRTQYTDQNPKVVAQRAAIDALRQSMKKLSAQDGKVPETQVALRRLLTQLGINMDVPGKAVFYNDLTGILMVRATEEDLAIVQAAIETLGGVANDQDAQTGRSGGGAASSAADLMRQRYRLGTRYGADSGKK